MPTCWIIAGPNGAGKTTFAEEFLVQEAGCPVFVNADLIIAELSPFQPELAAFKAGRLKIDAGENEWKQKFVIRFAGSGKSPAAGWDPGQKNRRTDQDPLVIYKVGKFHSPVKLGILSQPLSER